MKFYYTFILTVLFGLTTSAQGWEQWYGNITGELTTIIPAYDDGYLIGGDSEVRKIDATGNTVWLKWYNTRWLTHAENNTYASLWKIHNSTYLKKIDIDGNLLWNKVFTDSSATIEGFVHLENGGFLISGEKRDEENDTEYYYVFRTDEDGNELWRKNYPNILSNFTEVQKSNLTPTSDGGFVIIEATTKTVNDSIVYWDELTKIDAEGNILWSKTIGDTTLTHYGFYKSVVNTLDGGFALVGVEVLPFVGSKIILLKLDAEGEHQWAKTLVEENHLSPWYYYSMLVKVANDLIVLENGDLLFNMLFLDYPFNYYDDGLARVDQNGNVRWMKRLQLTGYRDYSLDINALLEGEDGKILLAGVNKNKCYVAQMDSLGNIYSNLLTGNVFQDFNVNCLLDSLETGLDDWTIEITGANTHYLRSDSMGNYQTLLDTGNYQIQPILPGPYWENCEEEVTFSFTNFYDTMAVDLPVLKSVDCPYLIVDISTPFLRRCFDNVYTVYYCNRGTEQAPDPWVEVEFDPYLTVNDASLPFTIENGLYVFPVDTLDLNECGSFTVNVSVDCDSTVLGQTHCVLAHIYPDSLCLTPDPNWSGASLELDAICNDSIIEFIITNVGEGDMNTELHYIVIEDDIIMYEDSEAPLLAGASSSILIPATGGTFRLEVDPIPGDPLEGTPSITVEGCRPDSIGDFSLGFFVNYSENDNNPFVAIDCQENIGSYDPNDKRGFPRGYGDEHFIEANTDIDYHIRFQNTGTDTAFTVVIADRLDPALDISSIRLGSSSHPFDFDFDSDQNLKFTFDNIHLPDSNVNEVASHGFVKFTVSQKQDNPIGTQIKNIALIYFDFNSPIVTNQTWHTIGEEYINVVTNTQEIANTKSVKVYPNPFATTTTFEWEGKNDGTQQFRLYNLTGQLLRQEQFTGTQFQFDRKGLTTGIYIYEILGAQQLIGKGKIIIR